MTIQNVPHDAPEREHRLVIATTVNELLKGRGNNVGACTLGASTTTTIVSDPRVMSTMKVFLSPKTSTAAAASPYVSAVADGSFTLVHDSNVATDRAFDYVLHGA